jgi:hypothetical protein
MRATAQTPGPDSAALVLRWTAPSECPTKDQVLDDARSLVVHSGATAPKTPVTVDAVVERLAEDRWSLTLAIGVAQQRVEASSCAQLARAGALFLALILDPLQAAPPGEPLSDAGATEPSAPLPPPLTPLTLPPPSPTPQPEHDAGPGPREVSLLAAAGLMLDVGTLPSAGPLGTLELGIRYRRLEVLLQGTAGPAQQNTVSGAAGARLQPLSALLTPCFAVLATERFRLGPCISGEVGTIHAEGLGVSQPRTTDAAWFSAGGSLEGSLRFGARFEARLDVGALAPVIRPNFELTGLGQVFEPGVAMRAGTAAVVRF